MRNFQGCSTNGLATIIALSSAASFLAFRSSAFGQLSAVPRDDFWITDGEVNALLVTNGVVYVGGNFQNVGPQRAFGADVDRLTGAVDLGAPKIDGPITAVVPDGGGGWFIARDVPLNTWAARSRLMHIREDKSIDSIWSADADGRIYVLLATTNRLYVGGDFEIIAGAPRHNLAALDMITGQPLQWDPSAGGASEVVLALALSGHTLIVGGGFTSVGSVARNSLAAIDSETGTVTTWNPRPEHNQSFPPTISALAVSETNIYVGGYFTSIGGSFRTNLAAVSLVNGFATPWNPNPDGQIVSMAIAGNTVFIAGTFTNIAGFARNSLVALDASAGTPTTWNPDPHPPLQVNRLLVDNGALFVAGGFTNLFGQNRNTAASFDLATGAITGWNPNVIAGAVATLAVQSGRVYLGGSFRSVNGVPRQSLAAFDLNTGVATSWNPGVSGAVSALALAGQSLYLGGFFTQIGVQPRTNLAAVDIATGQVASWSAELRGKVNALAIAGSNVYIGGEFASIAGQARTNLAAISFDGTVRSWNPDAPGWVQSLLATSNVIYVAGAFDQLAGQARLSVGAVDAESGLPTPFNPTFRPPWPNVGAILRMGINGLALQGDQLFATGTIREYLGGLVGLFSDHPYTASVDVSNSALKWDMDAGPIGITMFKNTLYVERWSNFLFAIDPASGAPKPWLPSGSGRQQVHVIAPAGDSLVVGGQFGTVNGVPLSNLAVFPPAPPAQLGAQIATNGVVRVQVSSEPGIESVLQSTTNFLNWDLIMTNSGSFYYDDTNAAKFPAMLYRALRLP